MAALICVHIRSAAMAATKRSRRKRASAVGRTVESSMRELKKSVEALRRMLEGYLPSGTRSRSSKAASRSAVRRSKRPSARRRKRTRRVA